MEFKFYNRGQDCIINDISRIQTLCAWISSIVYDCFNKNKELFNYSQYIQIYLAPVPVYGTLGMGKALFFRKHQTGTSYINR